MTSFLRGNCPWNIHKTLFSWFDHSQLFFNPKIMNYRRPLIWTSIRSTCLWDFVLRLWFRPLTVYLTFCQIQDIWLSMWLFDIILLWRHTCATIWRAIWLWHHNEKVCQQVRCRAFGDYTIGQDRPTDWGIIDKDLCNSLFQWFYNKCILLTPLLSLQVRSTTDTSGTGTRNAIPVNFL